MTNVHTETIASGSSVNLNLGYTTGQYQQSTQNGVTAFSVTYTVSYGTANSSQVSVSPPSGTYTAGIHTPTLTITAAPGPADVGKTFSISGTEFEGSPFGQTLTTSFTFNYTI